MTNTLKSALLDILPASERNLFQKTSVAESKIENLVASRQEFGGGVEALKTLIREVAPGVQFKYNKKTDVLYVYFVTQHQANTTMRKLNVANCTVGWTSGHSVRLSPVSAFNSKALDVETLEQFFARIKSGLDAGLDAIRGEQEIDAAVQMNTSLTIKNDINHQRSYAYVRTSRAMDADMIQAIERLVKRLDGRVNVSGAYGINMVFDRQDGTATDVNPASEAQTETETEKKEKINTLLAGMQADHTDQLTELLRDRGISEDTIKQVSRVLKGERLPVRKREPIYADVYTFGGKKLEFRELGVLQDLKAIRQRAAIQGFVHANSVWIGLDGREFAEDAEVTFFSHPDREVKDLFFVARFDDKHIHGQATHCVIVSGYTDE